MDETNLLLSKSYIDVVKQALTVVANDPVPGKFCFTIAFNTDCPGVVMPDWLVEQYPEIITIVLNYKYDHLKVSDSYFNVTLYFDNDPEFFSVPFEAVRFFFDETNGFKAEFVRPAQFDPPTKKDEHATVVKFSDYQKKKED